MATNNTNTAEATMASKKLQAAETALVGATVHVQHQTFKVADVSQPGGRGAIRLTLDNGITVDAGSATLKHNCGKCGGTGRVWATWVANGVCFRCGGTGGRTETATKAISRQQARTSAAARKQRKADEEKAARERKAAEFLASRPELKAALETDLEDARKQAILDDMYNRLKRWGDLSEKQVAYAIKLATQQPDPPAGDVPTGRVDVEGAVLTVKVQDGYYGSQIKMLVKLDNGAKLWGTCPAAIDPERGDRVAFTATCKAKDGERSFGYYSRPTKARILEEVAA
jgi:hypothetical protein